MTHRNPIGTAILWASCTLLTHGCSQSPVRIEHVQQAIGEPTSGFPSPEERLGIMAINRARSSPSTLAGPASTVYAAVAPVQLSYVLSRSSRFHARNLGLANVGLMNTSPCILLPFVATTTCDGNPTCACASAVAAACASCALTSPQSTCGTPAFTRIGYFTAGTTVSSTLEVTAAGFADGISAVAAWMSEAAGADGDRANLTSPLVNVMGYGVSTGTCFSNFHVSDIGFDAVVPTSLPTAAVQPPRGGPGLFTFYATWADAGGAPSDISVVIDGQCAPMSRELGTDTLNATYKTATTLVPGCHEYRVVAHDAVGTPHVYPTTGAVTIAVGTTCPVEWNPTVVPAACESGFAGSDLSFIDGDVPVDAGLEGPSLDGDLTVPNGDLSPSQSDLAGAAAAPGAASPTSSRGCTVALGAASSDALPWLFILVLLLTRGARWRVV